MSADSMRVFAGAITNNNVGDPGRLGKQLDLHVLKAGIAHDEWDRSESWGDSQRKSQGGGGRAKGC
jgi:hypothetical protein